VGAALVLAGGVAGLATGQSMANRAAHRTGACIALNMAAALGYLDAEQQRRLRHALTTAVNPHVDLFSGKRPSLEEACVTGG
jgi:2-methylcitrate dehydratase PrpD